MRNGLLIIQSQWRKRKQSKEAKKLAKKAKLEPDADQSALAKRQAADGDEGANGVEAEIDSASREESPTKTTPNIGQKATPSKRADERKPNEPAPAASPSVEKPSASVSLAAATSSGSSTSTVSETSSASPDTEAAAQPAESGRPSTAELRERLARKIESLRAQRKAPGTQNAPGEPTAEEARTRESILEARRLRKERQKEKRRQKKLADQQAEVGEDEGEGQKKAVELDTREGQAAPGFVYGNIKNEQDGARRKKGPTDAKGALKSLEAKKARVARYDAEKQAQIQESDAWHAALLSSRGEKVRNNETLLSRAVKRKGQQKKRSEKQWAERLERVEHGKQARQKRREDNLQKRRDAKRRGVADTKSSKSSAGGGGGGKKKRPARAGFEGSVRART